MSASLLVEFFASEGGFRDSGPMGRAASGDPSDIERMQGGIRAWVRRTSIRSAHDLRGVAPVAFVSLLCAAACSPLIALGAGIGGAAAVAGTTVLSSIGGGALSGIIATALDHIRLRHAQQASAPVDQEELANEIAQQIQEALAAENEHAKALWREIALVLKNIDAGGTALHAAIEQDNETLRKDMIDAISVLGAEFSEMEFLVKDVAQTAEEIQESLLEQGANVRVILEQNTRQSADILLVREELAAMGERTRSGPLAGAQQRDGVTRWVNRNPYRGLLPFGETDADVFYGRERLAAELAVKLAARATSGGLLVVTGASGAGKSSLLRAGLLPILARGQQVHGSEHWPRMVMTPGQNPLAELAAVMGALGANSPAAHRDELARRPDQAHLVVWSALLADAARPHEGQSASRDGAGRLILIVDQFEQVFTLNPGQEGEAIRQSFVAALCAIATNPVGTKQLPPAVVAIAVRGDFWDRCAVYPELVDALQDGQFVVGPMTESELRRAITGPADRAMLRIDRSLTDTILSDLRSAGDDMTGVLPLLSQAMLLTWEKREGDRLTNRAYGEAGGVSNAVQTSADGVYSALPADHQALAQRVLRSMTVTSRDGRLTRRPVKRADLYAEHPRAERSQIDEVLEAFAAKRLIVVDNGNAQIAHDALLSA
jgi:hypothetical protein